MIKKVCIQWPRFGPYHLARLRAAFRYFGDRGVTVVGMETAGRDATYAWRVEQSAEPFVRIQVFPDRTFETLRPSEIHRQVFATLDRIKPDAVAINSYSFPDARACLEWCRKNGRIAVVITDSKEDDAPRVTWREKIKALIINQFDAALLAGTPQREYFLKLGFPAERIFPGCDVVDNAYFRDQSLQAHGNRDRYRHLPGLEQDFPFFLTISRLIGVKNIARLISAYNLYREATKMPWNLVLVGDGPQRTELEDQIRRDSIEGITFAGFRQVEETAVYYGLAGAFILPTLKDTWGLVVNEAMAAGLPVLLSRLAGCAQDLVHEGTNGFLFDPLDVQELAHLLARLADPATNREAMGQASQDIISQWTPDVFAQNLWLAIESARSGTHPAANPLASGALFALKLLSRDVRAFHSVED